MTMTEEQLVLTEEQLAEVMIVLTEEQLAEVMNNLEQWFDKFEPEVRLYGNVALQAIRQLWAERERQRAVMAQAKEAILCMRIGKFFITPHSGEDVIAALESMGV